MLLWVTVNVDFAEINSSWIFWVKHTQLSQCTCLSIQQNIYQAVRKCLFVYLTRCILSCQRVLVYLFNKIHIKLSESADSVKAELIVNLNSQYVKIKFITDLKS